jgi:hypothetical protein
MCLTGLTQSKAITSDMLFPLTKGGHVGLKNTSPRVHKFIFIAPQHNLRSSKVPLCSLRFKLFDATLIATLIFVVFSSFLVFGFDVSCSMCGTLLYGKIRYGTLRYSMLQYGTFRYGTLRYGTLRYGIHYGMGCYGMVRFGCNY